ncbi:transcription initiation factor IIA subunit 2 isoform X1 [Marmota marmota marmota]|uniref:transcription initiation factor IIA subunit 2 isoform X1 n=1 Tax=Marmota marmota marmota TaxID=9994 RepID=UPI002092799F|nr:transcription initiation factor IIA subunit 2 isoform X1 [Marmota marmota marmota]XP_048649728.1 transcription initiation factor IIA subunit 2 isoform X1 [Marmota marmota marmota]
MAYQLYRNTTLGNSLQESLDELIQSQQITPQLALQVLLQFDKAINSALAQRVRNRVNFRVVPRTHPKISGPDALQFPLHDVCPSELGEIAIEMGVNHRFWRQFGSKINRTL